DGMRVAYKDKEIRDNINKADYVTIDGKPVLWIAKWLKKKQFKHKISGSDLTPEVLKLANEKGYTVAIFGGKNGVADMAKENIEKDYPNVKVVLTLCPKFGFENDEVLMKQYIEELNSSNADIYLMCTGFPKTEKYVFKYYDSFGPGLYLLVGATVDFLAGNIKRAPKWMSNCGLEWLYRLSKDFNRLFKRYWLDFWFLVKIFFICVFNKKKFENMK
nr:WecB/TagA/CpsF family glycosyltransferase [Acholeplasmatales bacterium]